MYLCFTGTSLDLPLGLWPSGKLYSSVKKDYSANDSLIGRAYKQASAIVGGKAIASENSELFFVDPNDTVLSQLLAVINIGEDLVNKGIDYWIGVKTSPHEELALVYPEV